LKELVIRDNPERHRFEADLGDGSLAVAEYVLLNRRIIFTHTEVPPEHEGKGIGSALTRHALDEARKRNLQVIPKCPFFAAYMQKHAEVQDLLDPAWRTKLGIE
jgi:predicted GNAT family acetyltransferase